MRYSLQFGVKIAHWASAETPALFSWWPPDCTTREATRLVSPHVGHVHAPAASIEMRQPRDFALRVSGLCIKKHLEASLLSLRSVMAHLPFPIARQAGFSVRDRCRQPPVSVQSVWALSKCTGGRKSSGLSKQRIRARLHRTRFTSTLRRCKRAPA